mmetsp:Transcript_41169/g.105247  ORF Transcript_41169/g.105247 Transcript_41169/m.105247 type:complete len:303 (-) Transcript_41169:22-930(-)
MARPTSRKASSAMKGSAVKPSRLDSSGSTSWSIPWNSMPTESVLPGSSPNVLTSSLPTYSSVHCRVALKCCGSRSSSSGSSGAAARPAVRSAYLGALQTVSMAVWSPLVFSSSVSIRGQQRPRACAIRLAWFMGPPPPGSWKLRRMMVKRSTRGRIARVEAPGCSAPQHASSSEVSGLSSASRPALSWSAGAADMTSVTASTICSTSSPSILSCELAVASGTTPYGTTSSYSALRSLTSFTRCDRQESQMWRRARAPAEEDSSCSSVACSSVSSCGSVDCGTLLSSADTSQSAYAPTMSAAV